MSQYSSIFYFFFFFFTTVNGDTRASYIPPCPSFTCGTLNISYPFWLSDPKRNSYCGYPGFGLSCTNQRPILHLPSDSYYVTQINYNQKTLTLVDIDLAYQSCPRAKHNVSFSFDTSTTNPTPSLNYNPIDLNLTFFFNCSFFPTDAEPIPCMNSGGNRSFVFGGVLGEIPRFDWHARCEESVVVPLLETEAKGLTLGGFGGALGLGFQVDWFVAGKCGVCEASQGYCGYSRYSGNYGSFVCYCEDGGYAEHCNYGYRSRKVLKAIIGVSLAVGAILLVCIVIFLRRFVKRTYVSNNKVEAFLKGYGSLGSKRFRYSKLKKMTNSFKDKLGEGGYGCVFKGKLKDGRLVAVKVLNNSKGNGEEFINEVASIGRTSHVNIVTLLGFCYEGSKRALIYEFMSNGSLEKFIYSNKSEGTKRILDWEKLFEIAVGIARGLEYLHRGCSTRILHFDIKPHNILLDDAFCPKISDFGLAKLCPKQESIISMQDARGTVGYTAPEVYCRNFGRVSHKSDVYSYGMMVLEMVGGRKNIDAGVENTSEIYFPHWIYDHIALENSSELIEIVEEEKKEIVRKMVFVGLWCIQTDPTNRPSMSKVVEMLEGSVKSLEMPPKPFLSPHQ